MIEARDRIVDEARSWIKTPFHHQGCLKGVAAGCGGLLIGVYGICGIPVPRIEDLPHFAKDWHLHERKERYLEILLRFARLIETPEVGDIAIWKIGHTYSHSGIIVNWPRVIEARWNLGVIESDVSIDPVLKSRSPLFLSPFPQ